MKNITSFQVEPSLPEKIAGLHDLAYNLFWSWSFRKLLLLRRINQDLWEYLNHNPVELLGLVDQKRLEEVASDDSFISHYQGVLENVNNYMNGATWFSKTYTNMENCSVAYFSAEFGITECLPIYSGGLGILAGDHLKSASDLGIPLVGIGLMYQEGYFQQYLNVDGWQQERYPQNDFYTMPVRPVSNGNRENLKIAVEFPGRSVTAQIWKAQVGRVVLYLLDTNLPENNAIDRAITDQLYGGSKEKRVQQEIILGIGGMRALNALGLRPGVCHMNEGHSAFLGLERIRMIMEESKLTFEEAHRAVKAGNIFTTHTPVPAGIDTFDPDLIKYYFSEYAKSINIDFDKFLALGRISKNSQSEPFNMAFLALNLSSYHNGVSKLHGEVSRKMWQVGWPDVPIDEIPITSITNGIHIRSWISHDMADLFYRYLGPRWITEPGDQSVWERIENLPGEELWRTHERRRERLIAFARRRLQSQLKKRGASPESIRVAMEVLNPSALTIGFARRFATYKRATLLLKDKDRLKAILTNKDFPVQFIFAGKAHPQDHEGKELIRQIVNFSKDPEVRKRIVFVENYDIVVSRYLVQGVDIWMNTPRRPMEASGTSGMKALANGALNFSIIDGWWAEAYEMDKNVGWSIGGGETYNDLTYQDMLESNEIYNLFESDIIPLFYNRGTDGVPWDWITKMKTAMSKLCPVFNTNRMVREYTERFYIPSFQKYSQMSENGLQKAKDLSAYVEKIKAKWNDLKIEKVESNINGNVKVGERIAVKVWVSTPGLSPDEINVQIYLGKVDPNKMIADGNTIDLSPASTENTVTCFEGEIECTQSGMFGFTTRILPKHDEITSPHELHLIHWQ